jgi:transcriptional regulator with XRE-family HTH domain
VIDLVATGDNIRRLRQERGLTVRDIQSYFGFEEPRAIYKWQRGESLPTVDNLYALGKLLGVPMDQILVPAPIQLHIVAEQQAGTCCSGFSMPGYSGYGRSPMQLQPFVPIPLRAA